jgi:ABC-type Fe3+-hydroxamate transport system substrate-binding protein
MAVFTDQLGRTIFMEGNPKRIISLVPSLTELLYDLGLETEVAGVTKFCVRPDHWFRKKPKVGGTKTPNLETIRKISPDLVIANKEENTKESIEELAKEYPVWISDIRNVQHALSAILLIGDITGKSAEADVLVQNIRSQFAKNAQPVHSLPFQAAYLIWRNPYMAVGGDTFIHDMMMSCGLVNIFAHRCRYFPIDFASLASSNRTLILLSSEPYPFKEKNKQELQHSLPEAKIMLVDGEMFSWYGSRLKYAPQYLHQLAKQIME